MTKVSILGEKNIKNISTPLSEQEIKEALVVYPYTKMLTALVAKAQRDKDPATFNEIGRVIQDVRTSLKNEGLNPKAL